MNYYLIAAAVLGLAILWAAKRYVPVMFRAMRAWLNFPSTNAVEALKAKVGAIKLEESAIKRIVAGVESTLLAGLPSAINEEHQRRLRGLQEQVTRLRHQKTWLPVVVRLHGFQVSHGIFTGKEMHAQVLMNVETGALQPHPDRMIEHDGSAYRHMPKTAHLGAPGWKHVPDDKYAIILLGVVYRLHYGRNQPIYP